VTGSCHSNKGFLLALARMFVIMQAHSIAEHMEIRPANASDLPAMTQIVVKAYQKYVERIGKTPAPMLDDYSVHVRAHAAWFAETDGVTVGLVVLLPGNDHLLLDNVAVDPAYHGRKIGRELVAFAEREAIRRGYAELRLYTHEKMTENLVMYLALGWEDTGRGEQAGYQRVFFRKHVRL
jgi:GNAT superfamily N-acetyltransferase